jgi:predicted PurR-regulated permease PerM
MDIENSEMPDPDQRQAKREPRDLARRVFLDPASPSFVSIARVVLITLVLLFVANKIESIIGSLSYLFFLLVLAIFFAYLLDPLVKIIRRPFEERKIERFMPRPLAIVIAYIVVFTVVGVGIASLAPRVVDQGKEFGANLPALANSLRQTVNDLNRRFDRLRVPEDVQTKIYDQGVLLGERITTGFGNFVINAVTYVPWLVIVPILAFFFLKDVNMIRLSFLRMFPPGRWRMRAEAVLRDVHITLAGYTRAMLISCLLIGTVCTIGFYVIGLKYALLLGILAGIFEFVPLIGPLAIGIIATSTAAFGDDPWRALYVAAFLIVLRIFHDYVSYPRIVRGGVHLHPLLIIISVIAGEQAAGIVGVFLAIPIVALVTVIYRHVIEHRSDRGTSPVEGENVGGIVEESGPKEANA